MGLGGVGGCAEVRVLEGIVRIGAAAPVELEEFSEERDGGGAVFSESLGKVSWSWVRLQGFRVGERPPSRHVFVGRGAAELKDDLELVTITLSSQDRLANKHLTKYTPTKVS